MTRLAGLSALWFVVLSGTTWLSLVLIFGAGVLGVRWAWRTPPDPGPPWRYQYGSVKISGPRRQD